MADMRLIVADLDGTILGSRDECQDSAVAFRAKLDELAGAAGFRWAVNTGRGIRSFRRVFRPLFRLGIMPDYIVVKHAYIFGVKRWGYLPHVIWNIQTWFSIALTRFRARRTIKRLTSTITARFRRVRCRPLGRYRIAFQFRSSETMKSAYHLLSDLALPHRNFIVSEHVRELVLSTIPFTKGLAVVHLARHLRIPRENVLCIGDGHNDISMLDGTAAAMTACPSNATVAVMRTVHDSGGHIARKPSLAGVLEAIESHESGAVNNELPADITLMEKSARNNNPLERSTGHHRMVPGVLRDVILLGLCFIAVLFALASAGMLGPLSRYLMLPVEKAAAFLVKLTAGGY